MLMMPRKGNKSGEEKHQYQIAGKNILDQKNLD